MIFLFESSFSQLSCLCLFQNLFTSSCPLRVTTRTRFVGFSHTRTPCSWNKWQVTLQYRSWPIITITATRQTALPTQIEFVKDSINTLLWPMTVTWSSSSLLKLIKQADPSFSTATWLSLHTTSMLCVARPRNWTQFSRIKSHDRNDWPHPLGHKDRQGWR